MVIRGWKCKLNLNYLQIPGTKFTGNVSIASREGMRPSESICKETIFYIHCIVGVMALMSTRKVTSRSLKLSQLTIRYYLPIVSYILSRSGFTYHSSSWPSIFHWLSVCMEKVLKLTDWEEAHKPFVNKGQTIRFLWSGVNTGENEKKKKMHPLVEKIDKLHP